MLVRGFLKPVSEAGFDHDQLAVFVWRADRVGGDTKTPKSRRTLALPRRCAEALREAIALLAGHNQTATTELVYRHQIAPALTRGAEVMDQIFG